MGRKHLLGVGLCLAFGLWSTGASAVPGGVQVQGVLTTSSGVPAPGPLTVTFKVWTAETGGTALYTWPSQEVQVTAGLFDTVLAAAPAGVFDGADRWLEIAVQGEPPLPRRPFRSVPYALVAGRAETAVLADALSCSGCVGASELDVPWAGSDTAGGAALDLACTGCVGSADIQDGGVALADLSGAAVASLRDWEQLAGVPAGFADGVDNVLSEAQVETYVKNGPIDLAAGTTIGGQPIGGGSSSLKMLSAESGSLAAGATLDLTHPSGLLVAVTAWYQRGDGVWEAIGGATGGGGCTACGTGNDGAYDATSNTTIAGGTYNFSSFRIRPGVTVTVTGSAPLVVLSKGEVLIEGALNLRGGDGGEGPPANSPGGVGGAGGGGGGGAGGAGGFYTSTYLQHTPGSGGAGGGPGGGVQAWDDGIGPGGGGGGFATPGGQGGTATCCASRCSGFWSPPYELAGSAGGSAYGAAPMAQLLGGSGGGGGGFGGADNGSGGGGGGGGGAVKIVATTIKVPGTIDARGGLGGDEYPGRDGGAGGGGSGGSVWLRAASVQASGSVLATGGAGGSTSIGGSCGLGGVGGTGAPGRIQIDAGSVSGSTSPAYGVGSTGDLATATWELTQPDATTVRLRNGSQSAYPAKLVIIHP